MMQGQPAGLRGQSAATARSLRPLALASQLLLRSQAQRPRLAPRLPRLHRPRRRPPHRLRQARAQRLVRRRAQRRHPPLTPRAMRPHQGRGQRRRRLLQRPRVRRALRPPPRLRRPPRLRQSPRTRRHPLPRRHPSPPPPRAPITCRLQVNRRSLAWARAPGMGTVTEERRGPRGSALVPRRWSSCRRAPEQQWHRAPA